MSQCTRARVCRVLVHDYVNDHEARTTCQALQERRAGSERKGADAAQQREAERGLKAKS